MAEHRCFANAQAVDSLKVRLLVLIRAKKSQQLPAHTLSKLERGYSSDGRALEWHSRGRRFDPD
jgi:hypothetical protein